METNKSSLDLVMILVLLAFAVVLIDDRLIRAGVTFVPALLLVQRAAALAAGGREPPKSERYQASKRSSNEDVRGYLDELLKDIKEFYTTCHLMAGGQLPPEEAKERASGIEKKLNLLLAKVSEAAKA